MVICGLQINHKDSLARLSIILIGVMLSVVTSCVGRSPLDQREGLYSSPTSAPEGPGIEVMFLGNSTLYVSDGETNLMVDGFLTRPGKIRSLLCCVSPSQSTIDRELRKAGIGELDGIFVGHAHYDHALDAPLLSEMKNCPVWGSQSYGFVHQSVVGNQKRWMPIKGERSKVCLGKFEVTLVRSDHAVPGNPIQKAAEGFVEEPFETPAPF